MSTVLQDYQTKARIITIIFFGNILKARCWDKINLIKFAFISFTMT